MKGPLSGKQIPIILKIESFLSRITYCSNTGCWEWRGALSRQGYGIFCQERKNIAAHRISFSVFKGPLLPKLVIDHICRNRKCVNPDHLRQVTQKENMLENSVGVAKINHLKTHCSNGHEFTEDNILKQPRGKRCRECKRSDSLKWYSKNGRQKPYKGRVCIPLKKKGEFHD